MLNKYVSLFLLLLLSSATSSAIAAESTGYWYNSSGEIVRNSSGECWRTIYWSSSNAIAECEGGTTKKAEADSDNDGVVDSKDNCPGTAAGMTVDNNGCAKDSDKDGIADSNDKCPRTSAGIDVDSRGCAKDSDNDGIANANDDCPNTARGTVVNTRGCKLAAASISLNNVQFNTGTAILSSSSKTILDDVAKTLNDNPHLNFEVAGHTDNTGNYQYNVNLSESRATSVRDYLVNKGVAANRLVAKGYGPDKPVASNGTREGRSINRRVELVAQ